MTDQPAKHDTSGPRVEVVVDGVRHPGKLHGIWRRGGQDVCEVSWRSRLGVTRIETVSAGDVWVVPHGSPLTPGGAEDTFDG